MAEALTRAVVIIMAVTVGTTVIVTSAMISHRHHNDHNCDKLTVAAGDGSDNGIEQDGNCDLGHFCDRSMIATEAIMTTMTVIVVVIKPRSRQ